MRIGYAPTRRNVFSREDALAQRDSVLDRIGPMGADIVDISDINEEGLLYQEADVDRAVRKFRDAGVDGLFFPHCNFGTEDLVAKTAKALGVPVLIWGPRDDAPLSDGTRTRDTQCGLFATGKVLRRFNVPFSYITNCAPTSEVFERGYRTFASACAAVKAFRSLRILQIAPRPSGFWTMICNEGELLERFGIQVHPVTLQDVSSRVEDLLRNRPAALIESLREVHTLAEGESGLGDVLERMAALKVAIRGLCDEYGCTAAAIQCWTSLQDVLGIMPCAVNGLLTDEWLPVTCETDIHGAISSILLQEANNRRSSVFFADLTVRHPTNDNAELLWHCGNFPPSLARSDQEKRIGRHFIFPTHCPGTGEWELRGGDITICRFDGDHGEYSLLIGEGRGVEGPRSRGTYVWFEVDDWPRWEERIVTGPYVHHCAGVHGKTAATLFEACKFIPGLRPDPMQPDADAIGRWLRGG